MTETYKKKRSLFFILSTLSWLGLCGILIGVGVSRGISSGGSESSIGSQILDIFMPLVTTYIVALCLFVFIREKLRNTIWIVNIVLSALLLGTNMVWLTIILFALDEFLFVPLYKHYKNKYIINKEIDKRIA